MVEIASGSTVKFLLYISRFAGMVLYVVVCVAMIVIVVRIWYCSGLRCNFLGRFVGDIDEVNVLVFIPVVSRFLWFLGRIWTYLVRDS